MIPAEKVDEFWSKVDKSGGPDACWPWALPSPSKYKSFRAGKGYLAGSHRIALSLATGVVPCGRSVQACHTCDNPPCCNPKHLWWGTAKDNTRDRMAKGR